MNQSGFQKTIGAMLLASTATLAIVIVGGETIDRIGDVEFRPVSTKSATETDGDLAWRPTQRSPSQWSSQNAFREPNQRQLPQQAFPPANRQTQQTNHVGTNATRSIEADASDQTQRVPSTHPGQAYQATNYPAFEYSNLPQTAKHQESTSSSIAAPEAITPATHLLSQRLPQAANRPIETAVPTPAHPASDGGSEISVLTQIDSVAGGTEQQLTQAPSVLQTSFETRILKPDSSLASAHLTRQIQVDKQGLKTTNHIIKNNTIDDTFVEAPIKDQPKPTAQPKPALHSAQPTTLTRQRVNPQVEAQARKRTKYGESLARRRSFHAAREEFILALLLISNSHQTEADENTNLRADRLAWALTALDEVGDLASMRNSHRQDAHFQQRVSSHRTQMLIGADLSTLSPSKMIDRYCGFAQSQIEQAIGYSVAGGEALHALGKLESMAPDTNAQHISTGQTRALVFFRAALSVHADNAVCANDLGVLLFNMGRLSAAENALRLSLKSTQSRLAWDNLASVHAQQASAAMATDQRNHQLRLAQMAQQEAKKFNNDPRNRGLADDQWATTSDFQNKAAFRDTVIQRASNISSEDPQPNGARVKAASFLKKVTGWD